MSRNHFENGVFVCILQSVRREKL